jgi:sugar phosphate isomerase/epimerase
MVMAIPKFGRLTNPRENILKEIELTAKLGFDFVEIGIEGPGGDPDILVRDKRRILKAIKDNGLFAIAHTPWWADLGSPYENVRHGWVEESKRAIRTVNQLKISLINFHGYSAGMFMTIPSAKKHILNNFVSSMRELVDYGSALGVKVMLENMPKKREICELPDMKYVTDRVKGLGFHLDIGHAYINGGLKAVLDYIRVFRPKLWHVHVHDNHGQEDEHLPLGIAKIEYEKVVSALKKIGYDKTITLEVFAKDLDYAQYSMNKLKKLWKEK